MQTCFTKDVTASAVSCCATPARQLLSSTCSCGAEVACVTRHEHFISCRQTKTRQSVLSDYVAKWSTGCGHHCVDTTTDTDTAVAWRSPLSSEPTMSNLAIVWQYCYPLSQYWQRPNNCLAVPLSIKQVLTSYKLSGSTVILSTNTDNILGNGVAVPLSYQSGMLAAVWQYRYPVSQYWQHPSKLCGSTVIVSVSSASSCVAVPLSCQPILTIS